MARRFRPPLSLQRVAQTQRKTGNEDKIIVVIGTVTDDERIVSLPKIKVSY